MSRRLNKFQKEILISEFKKKYRRSWNEFDDISLYEVLNPYDVIPEKEVIHNRHRIENGFRLSKMGEDGYLGDI